MEYFIHFEDGSSGYLAHHGVKGMKWGVRNEETRRRYSKEETPKKVFVSGSSKTQSKDQPYYRRKLPRDIRKELKGHMKRGDTMMVGDAPGIDRQVQDYLKSKRYKNVEVYSPGETRYLANKKWKNVNVDVPGTTPGSKEYLVGKDILMTKLSDEGIAVVIPNGAGATRNNVKRLQSQGKRVVTYIISDKGKKHDRPGID